MFLSSIYYIASDGVIVKYELEGMWQELDVTYFKVAQDLPGGPNKAKKKKYNNLTLG
jgi:hypothetical protein